VIGRARSKAVLEASAGGDRPYFYQPCQDSTPTHELDQSAAEKCRFTESQSKMEFSEAITAAEQNYGS